jgi:bacillithiol system protein YtxJ
MNWNLITDLADLETIKQQSHESPVLLFKHSTRCSVSSMVLSRFERQWANFNFSFNFLDLLEHRDISNAIAIEFDVVHQSPQVLIIKDGKCIETSSHNGINSIDLDKFTS